VRVRQHTCIKPYTSSLLKDVYTAHLMALRASICVVRARIPQQRWEGDDGGAGSPHVDVGGGGQQGGNHDGCHDGNEAVCQRQHQRRADLDAVATEVHTSALSNQRHVLRNTNTSVSVEKTRVPEPQ
jgi:hypothetical protein